MFISFLFVITLLYLPTRLPARRFSIISIIMQLSIFIRRQQSALFVLYALWWKTPRTIDKKVAYAFGRFSLWWEHCELPTIKSLMFGRVLRILRCLVWTLWTTDDEIAYVRSCCHYGGKRLELSTKKSLMRSVVFPRIFRCLVGNASNYRQKSRLCSVVFSASFDAWWEQVDSNHRPHAYQACALTGWAMFPF